MALCALVVLRMVDLAVYEQDHDHVSASHIQLHVSEISHDHDVDELSEHESLDDMTAHMSFHSLLSVYISAPAVAAVPINNGTSKYGVALGMHLNTPHSRPPVPPPLA